MKPFNLKSVLLAQLPEVEKLNDKSNKKVFSLMKLWR